MEYPPVHMGYLCDLVTGIDCENRVLIELEVAGFRLKTARKCMEKELSYSRQMPVGKCGIYFVKQIQERFLSLSF